MTTKSPCLPLLLGAGLAIICNIHANAQKAQRLLLLPFQMEENITSAAGKIVPSLCLDPDLPAPSQGTLHYWDKIDENANVADAFKSEDYKSGGSYSFMPMPSAGAPSTGIIISNDAKYESLSPQYREFINKRMDDLRVTKSKLSYDAKDSIQELIWQFRSLELLKLISTNHSADESFKLGKDTFEKLFGLQSDNGYMVHDIAISTYRELKMLQHLSDLMPHQYLLIRNSLDNSTFSCLDKDGNIILSNQKMEELIAKIGPEVADNDIIGLDVFDLNYEVGLSKSEAFRSRLELGIRQRYNKKVEILDSHALNQINDNLSYKQIQKLTEQDITHNSKTGKYRVKSQLLSQEDFDDEDWELDLVTESAAKAPVLDYVKQANRQLSDFTKGNVIKEFLVNFFKKWKGQSRANLYIKTAYSESMITFDEHGRIYIYTKSSN